MRIVEMVRNDIKNSSLLKTKFLIYAFNGRTFFQPHLFYFYAHFSPTTCILHHLAFLFGCPLAIFTLPITCI